MSSMNESSTDHVLRERRSRPVEVSSQKFSLFAYIAQGENIKFYKPKVKKKAKKFSQFFGHNQPTNLFDLVQIFEIEFLAIL